MQRDQKFKVGAGGIAKWFRAPVPLPEDPNSEPSTHIGWFTTVCNTSYRGPDVFFFWPLWAGVLTHTHTHTLTYT